MRLWPELEITHADLVKNAEIWLNKRGVRLTFHELVTSGHEQPDVIGWQGNHSVMIECKASHADFLADKKKSFRRYPEQGMGDYRIYFCPPEVIRISDLPEGWALVYFDGNKTKNIHKINGYSMNQWMDTLPFRGNKQAELKMMYSALRRLQIRGHLPEIYEGIKSVVRPQGT